MTSFFHDLENQLRAAAHKRTNAGGHPDTGETAPGPPGRERLTRGIPAVAAVAVTLAIVAVALGLLARGHSHPTAPAGGPAQLAGAGNPAQRQKEIGYITAAAMSAQRSAACRTQQAERLRTRFIHATPSQTLLSNLGVLRRPATAADLPKIPASLRTPTARLQAELIQAHQRLAAQPTQDTICFATISPHSGSTECGAGVSAIRDGQAATNEGAVESGVVPDGVASVTLRFPSRGGGPARSFTTTAHDNVYAVQLPPTLAGGNPQAKATVVWSAADGATLKTIPPFNRRAAARGCQRHPAQCGEQFGGSVGGFASGSASSSSASATATAPSLSPRPPASGARDALKARPAG